MSEITCTNCSHVNPAENSFCENCGLRLQPAASDSGFPIQPTRPASSPLPAGEMPDWLASLRPLDPEPSSEETASEQLPAEDTTSFYDSAQVLPDWLSNLSSPAVDSPAPQFSQPAQADLPAQSENIPPSKPEEDLAWMASLSNWGVTSVPEKEEPPSSPAQETEPDWLGSFSAGWSEPAASEPVAEQPLAAAELPDWLSKPESEQVPAAENAGFAQQDLPDWLNELNFGQSEPAAEPRLEEQTPDWLNEIKAEALAEEPLAAEMPVETPSEIDLSVPAIPEPGGFNLQSESGEADLSWLSALTSTPAEDSSASTISSGEQSASGEISPASDWKSAFISKPGETIGGAFVMDSSFSGFEPGEMENLSFLTGEPASAASQTPAVKPLEPSPSPFDGAPEAFEKKSGSMPFVGDDMPDWLSESSMIEAAAQTPEAARETAQSLPQLEPATLPAWLRAMRPVEAVAPHRSEHGDGSIERMGPLAGFQGALPTADLAAQYHRPTVYSGRLVISELQRSNINLLETMVSAETQPQTAQTDRKTGANRVMRIAVGLVLFAALVFVLLSGWEAPLPEFLPLEVASFQQALTQLTENSAEKPQILVAVDYEAGLSGELEPVSSEVMRYLFQRQVRVTLVSTNVVGGVLAQNLVQAASNPQAGIPEADTVINLGYLPGGINGLQAFTLRPKDLMPVSLDGKAAWEQIPLQGIGSLSDFDALLVLTDNADTARAWVEQIQPAMQDKPFLMVSSAQIAPLLQPYTDSKQIDGLLAGYNGGAAFVKLNPNPASLLQAYRSTYQIAILMVVVLIIIGALFGGRTSSSSTRKKAKKGGA